MNININLMDAVAEQHGTVIASLLALMLQQREKGLAKYGVGVEDARIGFDDWLQHAREELVDQLVYLQSAEKQYQNLRDAYTSLLEGLRAKGVMLEGCPEGWDIVLPSTRKGEVVVYIPDDYLTVHRTLGLHSRFTVYGTPAPGRVPAYLRIAPEPEEYNDGEISPVPASHE